MSNGNPFANWVINNQYPTLDQPQPTASEFGATLPTQPPDGGGTMTTEIKSTVTYGTIEGRIKVRPQRWDSMLKNWVATGPATYLELPAGTKRIAIDDEIEVDETENPNPPDVIVLPKGAKGVDVSAYQKGFFNKVSPDKFDFFMFRCSDGMNTSATSKYHDANGVDTALLEFADVGHASGKPWGIYHFLRPGNVEAQISKVRMIHQMLVDRGTPPRPGKFTDGAIFAGIWADVEDYSLSNENVKQFIAGVGIVSTTGIYTGKYVWEAVTSGADVWWANKPLWLAAYGANNGQIPPWEAPPIPRGWTAVNIWQYTSEGQLVITEWTGDGLDLNSAGPYAPTVKPPDPPTGATVDLLPYMMGTHKQQHTLQYTWAGGGTHGVQNMHSGNEWKIVKGTNGEYENLYYDDTWIYRAEDTSESPERFYTQSTNGTLGAAWIKRHMAVGEVCYTSKQVQHYLKAGCVPQNGGLVTDKLTLEAIYATFTFDSGITLPDVAFITWAAGEGYFFAKGYGLVGFKFSGGKSYISELALQGRPDLPINKPGCIDLSGRFYA